MSTETPKPTDEQKPAKPPGEFASRLLSRLGGMTLIGAATAIGGAVANSIANEQSWQCLDYPSWSCRGMLGIDARMASVFVVVAGAGLLIREAYARKDTVSDLLKGTHSVFSKPRPLLRLGNAVTIGGVTALAEAVAIRIGDRQVLDMILNMDPVTNMNSVISTGTASIIIPAIGVWLAGRELRGKRHTLTNLGEKPRKTPHPVKKSGKMPHP